MKKAGKIYYWRDADVVHITLNHSQRIVRDEQLGQSVFGGYDERGSLVEIQILMASEFFTSAALMSIEERMNRKSPKK